MSVFITATAQAMGKIEIPQPHLRELRRADSFINYGVAAVHKLLQKTPLPDNDTSGCGLIIGSAYGPMETNFDVLDQVVSQTQASPTLFSHSVFNAAAGYLTRIFDLQGPAFTVTDFALPFFQALQQATFLLNSAKLSQCLVLQVETYSQLLIDASSEISGDANSPWLSGGCACLLSKTSHRKAGDSRISQLEVTTCFAEPLQHLVFSGEMTINGKSESISSPLDAAALFCRVIDTRDQLNQVIEVDSPFGKVRLMLDK